MATYKELIYDVREMVNAYSDDSNLSDEHIAFILMNIRNMLSKQQMSNLRKSISKEALQLLCMELDKDDTCFSGMDVMRSKSPLPATLENSGRGDFHKAYVPGTRFADNINIVDYSVMPFLKNEKYVTKQLYISVDQYDHVLVYNTENKHLLLEKIEVEAVFEDPALAYELTCDYDESKDFMDTKFPIASDLISPMKNQALQELLLKFKFNRDLQNNAEDDQTAGAATKNQ